MLITFVDKNIKKIRFDQNVFLSKYQNIVCDMSLNIEGRSEQFLGLGFEPRYYQN